jgi:hypothetical protein
MKTDGIVHTRPQAGRGARDPGLPPTHYSERARWSGWSGGRGLRSLRRTSRPEWAPDCRSAATSPKPCSSPSGQSVPARGARVAGYGAQES